MTNLIFIFCAVAIGLIAGFGIGWEVRSRKVREYQDVLESFSKVVDKRDIDKLCIKVHEYRMHFHTIALLELAWKALDMCIDRLRWVNTNLSNEQPSLDDPRELIMNGVANTLNEVSGSSASLRGALKLTEFAHDHGYLWKEVKQYEQQTIQEIIERDQKYEQEYGEKYEHEQFKLGE